MAPNRYKCSLLICVFRPVAIINTITFIIIILIAIVTIMTVIILQFLQMVCYFMLHCMTLGHTNIMFSHISTALQRRSICGQERQEQGESILTSSSCLALNAFCLRQLHDKHLMNKWSAHLSCLVREHGGETQVNK